MSPILTEQHRTTEGHKTVGERPREFWWVRVSEHGIYSHRQESPNVGHICCHAKVLRHYLWLCQPAQGLTIVLVYLWFFSLPCLLVETLFPLVYRGNCVTPKKPQKRALPDGNQGKERKLLRCCVQPYCCESQPKQSRRWLYGADPTSGSITFLFDQCIRSSVQLQLNRINQPKQMPTESLQCLYDVS